MWIATHDEKCRLFRRGSLWFFGPLPLSLKCVMPLRDAPLLIMDTKDPEAGVLQGHTADGVETRGQRKLPALFFTHSVLTCACAALCVYTLCKGHRTETYRTQNETLLPLDKGIYLNMKKISSEVTKPYFNLNFTVTWNNSLELKHGSEVIVPVAGPYIFYICAFVNGTGNKSDLILSQGHRNFSFELSASSGKKCVRQQTLISLYEQEKVTFSFRNPNPPYLGLEILRVGLHYLLGAQKFITPEYDPSV